MGEDNKLIYNHTYSSIITDEDKLEYYVNNRDFGSPEDDDAIYLKDKLKGYFVRFT